MPAPLGNDLRQRIIAAWERGEGSWRQLAERFGVGQATVNRWIGRYRRTGSVDPAPHGGGQPALIPDDRLATLKAIVDGKPDLTWEEYAVLYEVETKQPVSRSTIGRALDRLGYTRKKKPSSRRSSSSSVRRSSARRSSRR